MQLYSILILAELWRFMQAGVGWDFGTPQEFFGFLGMFEIRTGWAALDGIHGLPWKHNRNMFKNKRVKCIHVWDQGNTYIYAFFYKEPVMPFKCLHLNTGSQDQLLAIMCSNTILTPICSGSCFLQHLYQRAGNGTYCFCPASNTKVISTDFNFFFLNLITPYV